MSKKHKSNRHEYPHLPETEAVLRCESKRRLFRALKQCQTRFIADWLLQNAHHHFHHNVPIPNHAFDNALAVRAIQKPVYSDPGNACSSSMADEQAQKFNEGKDMFLVPVGFRGGKLVGYTFGGLMQPAQNAPACPYGGPTNPFFPHFVGRFSFDVNTDELLVVVNGHPPNLTCILHIIRTGACERERSQFVVPKQQYAYKKLPGKIMSLVAGTERSLASNPKYQHSVTTDVTKLSTPAFSSDMNVLTSALAKLERFLKGNFYSPKIRRDDMDDASGEVMNRMTMQTETSFDVKDAVGMNVCRDMAVRVYYSYMSALTRGNSSGKAL